MDIFSKHKRSATISFSIGLVLVIVSVAVLCYGLLVSSATTQASWIDTESPTRTAAIISTVLIFIGLIISIGSCRAIARTSKIKKLVQAKYPHYEDFLFLEEHKDFAVPAQKVFVKDDLLFSEYSGLNAVDLSDVAYLYHDSVRGRYGQRPFLIAYAKSKRNKKTWLQLDGRGTNAERAELEPLLDFLQAKYPDMLISKSKAHRQQYLTSFHS